jgi:hypothetical protein
MSWDFSATTSRHPRSVAAKELGKVARYPSSGEKPPPLATSKPLGTNHLAVRRRRAPAETKRGLHHGGWEKAALLAIGRSVHGAECVVALVNEPPEIEQAPSGQEHRTTPSSPLASTAGQRKNQGPNCVRCLWSLLIGWDVGPNILCQLSINTLRRREKNSCLNE